MICQICAAREGTIQVLEYLAGQQRRIWVCGSCAAARHDVVGDESEPDSDDVVSLSSFFGQAMANEGEGVQVPACPACGCEIATFKETNRLGCATCYTHFRAELLPILERFHLHATHLGRVPRNAGGQADSLSEVTRLRVALEKCIRGEDYEEAARLRDRIRELSTSNREAPDPRAEQS